MLVQPLDLLEVSRRLSAALAPADLDETLSRITKAAIEVLPDVSHASITVKHADGSLETVAPTHDLLRELDAKQYELQEGPCYLSAVETVHVTAPHLGRDERFPRYAQFAVGAGIEAQAGIRLFEARGSNGALNLYSEKPGAFEDLDTIRDLFTHQSAMALAYAREISELRQAITTRQLIGQAVGMLMERYQLDEAHAFAFLTRLSQDSNVKVRLVAERLIEELGRPETQPAR